MQQRSQGGLLLMWVLGAHSLMGIRTLPCSRGVANQLRHLRFRPVLAAEYSSDDDPWGGGPAAQQEQPRGGRGRGRGRGGGGWGGGRGGGRGGGYAGGYRKRETGVTGDGLDHVYGLTPVLNALQAHRTP